MKDSQHRPTTRIFNLSNVEPFESLAAFRARRRAQASPLPPPVKDGTHYASLLLRRLAAEGPRVSILRELAQLERVEPIAWSRVGIELAAAIRAITSDSFEPGIVSAVTAFQRVVPAASWTEAATRAADGDTAAFLPLCEDEELHLARHALRYACEEIARFRSLVAGDDREQAIGLAATLPLHFWIAAEAARRVRNRRLRAQLRTELDRASSGMQYFSELLHMEPPIAWHASFSTAFDAENALRFALGVSAANRT